MGHRKLLQRFHEQGHLHEFTFSCYQQRPLLTNEQWLTWLSATLDTACSIERIDLVAFVFMPEHVHLLMAPRSDELGRFLARVKQPFSKLVRAYLEQSNPELLRELTIQERPGKSSFRFWQAGAGYDRNIVSEDAFYSSINYIHTNPVKRGLCPTAQDWKWSSARYHFLDPPGQQFEGLPFVHGLRDWKP